MLFLDFYVFYAASKVLQGGGNVYDPAQYGAALRLLGWPADKVIMPFPYPPQALWLFYPLSVLSFEAACAVWLTVGLLLLAAAVRGLPVLVGGAGARLAPAHLALALAAFVPLWKMVLFGQFTALLLFALCAALAAQAHGRSGRAGFWLSLTMLKFTLFLPLYAAVLVRCLRAKDGRLVMGWAAGLAAQLGLSLMIAPEALGAFMRALRVILPEALLQQPTLPGLLSGWLPSAGLWSGLIGAGLGAFLALRLKPAAEGALFVLAPLGLLLAPYAWSHDFLLALPVYLGVAAWAFDAWRERSVMLALFLLAVLAAVMLALDWEAGLVWIPGVLLMAGLRLSSGRDRPCNLAVQASA